MIGTLHRRECRRLLFRQSIEKRTFCNQAIPGPGDRFDASGRRRRIVQGPAKLPNDLPHNIDRRTGAGPDSVEQLVGAYGATALLRQQHQDGHGLWRQTALGTLLQDSMTTKIDKAITNLQVAGVGRAEGG